MFPASRRRFLQAGLIGAACACVAARAAIAADAPAPSPTGKWMCPPCGCSADGKTFDAPGACPACGMDLVPKPAEPPKEPKPEAPKAQDAGGALAASAPARRPAGATAEGEWSGWGTRTRT